MTKLDIKKWNYIIELRRRTGSDRSNARLEIKADQLMNGTFDDDDWMGIKRVGKTYRYNWTEHQARRNKGYIKDITPTPFQYPKLRLV